MQPARGRFARFDLDRQIASTFPAHWKVGPAPVFGASQPLADPKLTYNSHIRKTSDKARNTLKLLKALTSTKGGKQKETIVATYKAITRPILEYA